MESYDLTKTIPNMQNNNFVVEAVYGVRPDKHTGGREYLVKWEGAGHIHNEYIPQTQQNQIPFLAEAIAEFHLKHPNQQYGVSYVRKEWTRVEHVITRTNDLVFVKWCGLGYDQATWESPSVLPPLPESSPHCSPSLSAEDVLMPHQKEWFNTLVDSWRSKPAHGTILAHGSGTGKRVSVTMFLDKIIAQKTDQPINIEDPEDNRHIALVLVPYETLADWKFAFETFAPQLKTVKYTGNSIGRHVIRKCYRSNVHIILTSFHIAKSDAYLENTRWSCVVTESTSNTTADIIYKCRDTFTTINNVIVISNLEKHDSSRLELLSDITYPTSEHKPTANQIRSKYLSKQNITGELPKHQVSLNMSPIQRSCYTALLNRAKKKLNSVTHPVCYTHRQDLMYTVAQLIQCAQHPFALFSHQPHIEGSDSHPTDALMQGSAKLLAVNSILNAAQETPFGVAIVCKSIRTLDILEEFLLQRSDTQFSRVDISASVNGRKRSIDKFIRSNEDCILVPSRPTPKFAPGGDNSSESIDSGKDQHFSSNSQRQLVILLFDDSWSLYTGIERENCHVVLRLVNIDTIEQTLLDEATESSVDTFLRYLRSFVSCIPIEQILRKKAVDSVWHGQRQMSVLDWNKVAEQIYLSESWIKSAVLGDASTLGDYPHPLVNRVNSGTNPIPTDHSNFWELLLRKTSNIEYESGWKEGEELSKLLNGNGYEVEDPSTCMLPEQEIQIFAESLDSTSYIPKSNKQAAIEFVVAHGLDQRGIDAQIIPALPFSEVGKTLSYLKKVITEIIKTDYNSATMERIGFLHTAVTALLTPYCDLGISEYQQWTTEHDFMLLRAVLRCGYGNWKETAKTVAMMIPSDHIQKDSAVFQRLLSIKSCVESDSNPIHNGNYSELILFLKDRLEAIQLLLTKLYWKEEPLPPVQPINTTSSDSNNSKTNSSVSTTMHKTGKITVPRTYSNRSPQRPLSSELNPSRPAWTFTSGSRNHPSPSPSSTTSPNTQQSMLQQNNTTSPVRRRRFSAMTHRPPYSTPSTSLHPVAMQQQRQQQPRRRRTPPAVLSTPPNNNSRSTSGDSR